MLFLADREKEGWLDISQIENFSCKELKEIDKLWVDNSGGNFGFSVQKEIWVNTGNRLGIKPEDWKDSDYKNYLRFASAVGWYNDENNNERESGFVQYDNYIKTVRDEPGSPKIRGGLPLAATFGGFGLGFGAWLGRLSSGREGSGVVLFSRCDL